MYLSFPSTEDTALGARLKKAVTVRSHEAKDTTGTSTGADLRSRRSQALLHRYLALAAPVPAPLPLTQAPPRSPSLARTVASTRAEPPTAHDAPLSRAPAQPGASTAKRQRVDSPTAATEADAADADAVATSVVSSSAPVASADSQRVLPPAHDTLDLLMPLKGTSARELRKQPRPSPSLPPLALQAQDFVVRVMHDAAYRSSVLVMPEVRIYRCRD